MHSKLILVVLISWTLGRSDAQLTNSTAPVTKITAGRENENFCSLDSRHISITQRLESLATLHDTSNVNPMHVIESLKCYNTMPQITGNTTVLEKFNTLVSSSISKMSPVINGNTINSNKSIFHQPLAVSEFIASILPVIENITLLPLNQLSPNPSTNALFTSLVNLICRDDLKENEVSSILSHSAIISYQPFLMEQCSSAEYFLEASFAREITYGTKCIEDFMYYDNYVSLVKFEMDSLKMYKNNISIAQVAVIGSGPLPLTSVEILKHLPPSVTVMNYDHSNEAVDLAKYVVNNKERIFVENRTALEITAKDLNQVNLVYLAALVGTTDKEKKQIINHLHNVMKPESILIARSAVGLKTLIYKRLTKVEFGKFTNLQEFHPKDNKVLNSIMCGTR